MRRTYHMTTKFLQMTAKLLVTLLGLVVLNVFAQEAATESKTAESKITDTKAADAKAVEASVADSQTKKTDTKPAAQPAKKMVQDATINLQTTITGNQEQPRVLYILPWQSPQTANVDFEPLENEQKAVFGHVEREELRRELESAGEVP